MTKSGYPLWLLSWLDLYLTFDGLDQATHDFPQLQISNVNAFMENLKSSKAWDSYSAYLADSTKNLEATPSKKGYITKGLKAEPEFLTEFDSYFHETTQTSQTPKSSLLPYAIDESAVLSRLTELEQKQASLKKTIENFYTCLKLVDSLTRQHIEAIREKKRETTQEFAAKIKDEDRVVAPRIMRLKDDFDFQIANMAKIYERQILPIQQAKKRLEKTKIHASERIEQYKQEAKTAGDKNHATAEEKWKEKADKTRKELSEMEYELKQKEEQLQELDEKRSVEIFKLKDELELKTREAQTNLLELEAERDAKTLMYDQGIERLEAQSKTAMELIDKIIKMLEENLVHFTTAGIRKTTDSEENMLCYVPFYIVCFQEGTNRRYMMLPPSTVNTVGSLTKLKAVLGMANIKNFFVPRFSAITSLVNSVQSLMEKNLAFKADINDLGLENNLLDSTETCHSIGVGLEKLKSEGWLSDKEYDAIQQKLTRS
jgi:hypothetical protein